MGCAGGLTHPASPMSLHFTPGLSWEVVEGDARGWRGAGSDAGGAAQAGAGSGSRGWQQGQRGGILPGTGVGTRTGVMREPCVADCWAGLEKPCWISWWCCGHRALARLWKPSCQSVSENGCFLALFQTKIAKTKSGPSWGIPQPVSAVTLPVSRTPEGQQ